MADEAYHIGPAASTLSYLNQDKIFEVGDIISAYIVNDVVIINHLNPF